MPEVDEIQALAAVYRQAVRAKDAANAWPS